MSSPYAASHLGRASTLALHESMEARIHANYDAAAASLQPPLRLVLMALLTSGRLGPAARALIHSQAARLASAQGIPIPLAEQRLTTSVSFAVVDKRRSRF
eukprot:CAMPEP_0184690006 /NCGR_PEP_ID=MMETSP0312-20130426/30975_1 /TAXON_ID=31354 /ORGANISM="Compsopogon coeruleus, Strain SAG 36.94" /LENGTH=100 /DNA_ID=CAMNT_0027147423 /DNA_START=853 /DNA_END=1155 /DNA_ORIENTATION=+